MREIEINRIKSAAKIFNDFRCTIFIDERQGANTVEELQEQKNSFLESIANEYGVLGSHREIFLERYSPKNQCCQNHEIAKYIGKSEKDLQDALTAIHKLIENKEPDLKGKLLKKERGRPAKGEEPWAKLSEFLWEKKFPNYYENNNQETTKYQKLTVIFFRRMLEDKIKKLTTNSLLGNLCFDTEDLYVPLGLVERKQKPHHGDIKPEHGSTFYRLNNDAITREFTYEEFLDEVVTNENSSKSQGRRLAIIGEPGSGKTTRLQQIARWLFEQNTDNRVIWVSLAELQGKTLEEYLLTDWLRNAHEHRKTSETQKDELVEEFKQGNIWLLLDGIDEIGSSGLSLFDKLPTWIKLAKIIVTCRLNIWDGSPRALSGFDVYYNDDFNDEQQKQFVINFLKNENDAQSLIEGLNQPGKERIKDLVKNPLRLTLICYWWQSHKGSLPDTKADLYGKFVETYYDWKKVSEAQISDSKKKEFEKALGRLAIQGLERDKSHFRFTKRQINEVLGEADEGMFKLAVQLGWLNDVGLSEEKSEKIYTFFHPSFQEYFAALAIDEPDYLLKHIPQNPQKGTYKILEPQWLEIGLLWIGRPDIDNNQKDKLIDKLFSLNFFPNSAHIYSIKGSIVATQLISEFAQSKNTKNIIEYSVNIVFESQISSKKSIFTWHLREELSKAIYQNNNPYLLKKINQILELRLEEIDVWFYLPAGILSLAEFIMKKNKDNILAQKVIRDYDLAFPGKRPKLNQSNDDKYYNSGGVYNNQQHFNQFFINTVKSIYENETYNTLEFWNRYEKGIIYRIPFGGDLLEPIKPIQNKSHVEEETQIESYLPEELINDEKWIESNSINSKIINDLFAQEPRYLFLSNCLDIFLYKVLLEENEVLLNIIEDHIGGFYSDERYKDIIVNKFNCCLDKIRQLLWPNRYEYLSYLIVERFEYDFYSYKYPEDKISIYEYRKKLRIQKIKEKKYDRLPQKLIRLALKMPDYNLFCMIVKLIIDLENDYNLINSNFTELILAKVFEFDNQNELIPIEITSYLADRLSYPEFYQQWRDHNQLHNQQYLSMQTIDQTSSLSINTENLNLETNEVNLLKRFKIRLLNSLSGEIQFQINEFIKNQPQSSDMTVNSLSYEIENIIIEIKTQLQIDDLTLFLNNSNPSQLLLDLREKFSDIVQIEWNR